MGHFMPQFIHNHSDGLRVIASIESCRTRPTHVLKTGFAFSQISGLPNSNLSGNATGQSDASILDPFIIRRELSSYSGTILI